jgi:transposase-like protein
MSGNRNVLPSEKLQAVKEYLAGNGSFATIAQKYGVSTSPFKQWVAKYKAFGESAFIRTGHNASYTPEFKTMVAKAYLRGEGSLQDLAIKYKISTQDTVRRWVLKYNGHEELKSSGTGGSIIMTKGRKTTYEERIEIIQYCIEHKNNYAETADKYQVSYQQVYTWVKKYETKGVEGLHDRRGRSKSEIEMTELEKLRAENRLLKATNKRQEMEMTFLKKLDEVERRRF